jgi:hypothetical protein
MKLLARFAEWFIKEPRVVPNRDRFDVVVVSPSGERFSVAALPFELRFVCGHLDGAEEKIRALLDRGIGLGVRTTPRVSASVLDAVERVSMIAEERTLEPWLSRLVFHEEIPVFTDDDIAEANARGSNLYTDAHIILSERFTMIRIVPVDLEAHGLEEDDLAFIQELNRTVEPLSAAFLHHRIRLDRRADAPPVRRLLISTLLAIAPIAHLLLMFVPGLGRLFAAIADDAARESSELVLLRTSGFTPKQLMRQGIVYLPVILLVEVLLIAEGSFIAAGAFFTAGLLFGIACISFPLVRSVQTFGELRSSYVKLHESRKYSKDASMGMSAMAFREAASHPDLVGSAVGIIAVPIIAACTFALFPAYLLNGWFLASFSALDVLLAILFLAAARACSRATFLSRVRPLAARAPSSARQPVAEQTAD